MKKKSSSVEPETGLVGSSETDSKEASDKSTLSILVDQNTEGDTKFCKQVIKEFKFPFHIKHPHLSMLSTLVNAEMAELPLGLFLQRAIASILMSQVLQTSSSCISPYIFAGILTI